MNIAGLEIPGELLDAMRDERLVIFAGAGVSIGQPAGLPNFEDLARTVGLGTGEAPRDDESEDAYLGRLKQSRSVRVHELAAQELKRRNPKPNDLHSNLLRIYLNTEYVRLVTTNFDLLFEKAAHEVLSSQPELFRAPALPLGRSFRGIVHVHGALTHPSEMVITDADFGRAYLTEGWARRFLVDLFSSFTVLFVGYSHRDIVMRYFARALPASQTKRFALTNERDQARWSPLNIEPIVYPSTGDTDHLALYVGVKGLADYSRRGSNDWKREITRLAKRPPPSDEEESDLMIAALSQPRLVRFFTSAANHPDWIDWLDERGFLDKLFGDEVTQTQDRQLALWLADRFAIKYSSKVFLLIAKRNMFMHPELWFAISRAMQSNIEEQIETNVLSRWVSLLLLSSPRSRDDHTLRELAQACFDCGLTNSLIDIFDIMADTGFRIKEGYAFPGTLTSEDDAPVDIESLDNDGKHYYLNDVWETMLRPVLPSVAEPLLVRIIRRLETQHLTYVDWQLGDSNQDRTSYRRSAIEPHPQDQHPAAVDVVIDVVRDCLEQVASLDPGQLEGWCNRLTPSPAPIVRRLAVHVLPLRSDLDADGKADWILANNGLNNIATHHETYRAVRAIYPALSSHKRLDIVEAVDIYCWPYRDDPEYDRRTAYVKYRWLHWLSQGYPDCDITKGALDRVQEIYPDFRQSPHPDFLHWTESGRMITPQSPWSAEELVLESPRERLSSLLSFRQSDLYEPSREGLLRALEEAATLSFEWGYDLAGTLADSEQWETDIWPVLTRTWQAELTVDKHRLVLENLSRPELYPKHTRATAEVLHALVKPDGPTYAAELLPEANRLAIQLWGTIDPDEPLIGRDDWLEKSINHSAGILASYWVGSLSLWADMQENRPDSAPRDYRDSLTRIVNEGTLAGRLARTALAWNFSFLHSVDAEWVTKHFLVLLGRHDDQDDSQALWDGITAGRLTHGAAKMLKNAFFAAMENMYTTFSGSERIDRFIDMYTAMLFYVVDSPVNKWIPEFFRYATSIDRHRFCSQIGFFIRNLNDTEQRNVWSKWICIYWENRLYGVPVALDDKEIMMMLDWVPHFEGLLPDVVDSAIKMPKCQAVSGADIGSIIFSIKKESIWERSPDAAARFLIYLKPYLFLHYSPSDIISVIDEIRSTSLESDIDDALGELYEELG